MPIGTRQPPLLTTRATPRRIRYVTVQLLRAPFTFILSIPITLIAGPAIGMASWGLMVGLGVAIIRSFRDLDDSRLDASRPAVPDSLGSAPV